MKKILYTMPAVIILVLYGMLALLAGGVASFQPRAWLMILLLLLSAVLLLRGKWWGAVPGALLGGLMLGLGMMGDNVFLLAFGAAFLVYYIIMGILCRKDAGQKV